MQHFHATIVIQHVSRNKITFMQHVIQQNLFHAKYLMFCATSFIQQKQFFAKYFIQQKLFHETYSIS